MSRGWLLAIAGLWAGCGGGLDNGNPMSSVFGVNGMVTGTSVPMAGKVFAIWHVLDVQSDPQSPTGNDLVPDYDYKFGEGTSSAFSFSAAWAANPPDGALPSYGFGTATLLLRGSGNLIADGRLTDFVTDADGDSGNYRIVYRAPGATNVWPFMASFPDGFSCAQCKSDDTGANATLLVADCKVMAMATPADGFNDCWALPF